METDFDKITSQIIGSAIEVHKILGPGLLESIYEQCLMRELELRGLHVQRQAPVPLTYKGIECECGYRLDLLVNNAVIVELKTVTAFEPIHEAQLLSHLKLMDKRVGLLINFHVPLLRDGVKRLVNNL